MRDCARGSAVMASSTGLQSAMKPAPKCTNCRGATRHYMRLIDPGTSRQRDLFRCETCGKHVWAGVILEAAAT